jgi:hypothetical protein
MDECTSNSPLCFRHQCQQKNCLYGNDRTTWVLKLKDRTDRCLRVASAKSVRGSNLRSPLTHSSRTRTLVTSTPPSHSSYPSPATLWQFRHISRFTHSAQNSSRAGSTWCLSVSGGFVCCTPLLPLAVSLVLPDA